MSSSESAPVRVVIPARYGSTRLPGKPLIDLAGKPMIVRVYERVKDALPASTVVVATDDERIQAVLAACHVPCAMTDPAHASGTDRAAEVARRAGWGDHDIVLNVQGDEPLVPPALLQAFVDYCGSARQLAMATIVSPIVERDLVDDVNIVKVVTDQNNRALFFSRAPIPFTRDRNRDRAAQGGVPEVFLRHIGIYAYRNAVLQQLTCSAPCEMERREQLEQLRALWLGVPILVMRWSDSVPAGVDTSEDVARVVNLFTLSKQSNR
ncbi:3-deoxy-manno-octulosonate cytidylyltransferase [Paraburkholderia fungorum]|uniref:3-deoxy-manno-octulosonate cytidylyltransferase n=1 Tax=Paraburkholderia fungorum TaxID=134537 RepID=A0A3R7HL98_9BURK|nr:3-deoxy-manno-octulosonate cytidylyltransferase [Paraburkholderia fungorum]RKF51031.1 3-deoxy-manno-octulosonate cytidylyltransferase [Paraburkholderia fungorum]